MTKAFNEMKFPQRTNLSFIADDIVHALERIPATNGILFHARTGTFLSKPVLSAIYKMARECGYRTVVLYEPFGISRVTNAPYEFNYQDQPSISYFNGMIIHNYPHMLVDAGYAVTQANVIETDFPWHPDHRLIELVAAVRG
jgi:hypothetical protein